ncbi:MULTISPECIES: PRC-barrel domain-containing protein [unclassified Roseitalea]|uniref:PRC-barrel domain-containing protein n=1 Tax=unclassified Roseitalea TaxID=2639107 RepID=UPI00273E9608|nr:MULTISPECIES: PRC-barrel domain-containing protein [unclassified Roseitalea]
MNRLTIGMLMAATAIVPPAIAQDDNDLADECMELVEFVETEDTGETGITLERAHQVAEQNDPQLCTDAYRVATGEISRDELRSNYDAEATARLAVIIPEPEVTVDQQAPEVEVQQQRPEVTVQPGRPVVTVNQAQPNVSVELAAPRITIDIPKPEIVVEMPDPTVDVAMRQPRVRVTQPEPTVEVEQGEVRLDVGETQSADDDEQAQVQIEQDQAMVELEAAEQAEVSIQDVQPDVRYNASEPQINVEQMGEPEITFNQSGEANVQFRQMTRDETIAAAEGRMAGGDAEDEIDNTEAAAQAESEMQDMADTQADETTMADQTETAMTTDQSETAMTDASEGETGMSTIEPDQDRLAQGDDANSELISVERIMQMQVVGADGETIGDIEQAVIRDGELFVIVGDGGFLGLGERQVALPMSDMVLRDDQLVMASTTEEQVERMNEVNMDEFQVVEGDAEQRVATE